MAARGDRERPGSNCLRAPDVVRGVADHPHPLRGELDPMELAGPAQSEGPQLVAALAVVPECPEWEVVPKTVVAKLYFGGPPRVARQKPLGDRSPSGTLREEGADAGQNPGARLCHLPGKGVQIGLLVITKTYFVRGQIAPSKYLTYNPPVRAARVLNAFREICYSKDMVQCMSQSPQACAARSNESTIYVPKQEE